PLAGSTGAPIAPSNVVTATRGSTAQPGGVAHPYSAGLGLPLPLPAAPFVAPASSTLPAVSGEIRTRMALPGTCSVGARRGRMSPAGLAPVATSWPRVGRAWRVGVISCAFMSPTALAPVMDESPEVTWTGPVASIRVKPPLALGLLSAGSLAPLAAE